MDAARSLVDEAPDAGASSKAVSKAAWRYAAEEYVKNNCGWTRWMVVLRLSCELGAWLVGFGMAIGATNTLFLFMGVAVRIALAYSQSTLGELTKNSAKIVFPGRYSCFGIHPQQRSPKAYYWFLFLLIGGFLYALVCGTQVHLAKHFALPRCEGTASSRNSSQLARHRFEYDVPAWVQCTADPYTYDKCRREAGFWAQNSCNITFVTASGNTGILMVIMLMPLALSVILLLLCPCCSCCDSELSLQSRREIFEKARLVDQGQVEEAIQPWYMLYFEAAMYCIDFLALDVLTIYSFFQTMNGWFGSLASIIYLRSALELYNEGGISTMMEELTKSVDRGLMTDRLFTILQKEKTNEAVQSMSLQYYGFMYVAFSWYAPYTFAVSMMFSARNVIKGAYESIHLGADCDADMTEDGLCIGNAPGSSPSTCDEPVPTAAP